MTTKIPIIQRSFAAGEVSPDLWGRTDLIKYQTGLAVGRNCFVRFQGGISNRAGTQYVGVNPDLDDGLSPRVVPFIFNNEQAYVLEFDTRGIRIIQDGSYITTTAKTITGATNASPIVLTVPQHGLAVNDRFFVADVVGMDRTNGISGLNGRMFEVAGATTDTITLGDPFGATLSSAAWTAYSSGGEIQPILEINGDDYAQIADVPKFELNFVQSGDVLTITHPDIPPYSLSRVSQTEWTLEREVYGPTLSPPVGLVAESESPVDDFAYYLYTYCVTAAVAETGDESAPSEPVTYRQQAQYTLDGVAFDTSRKMTWNAVSGANLYRLYKAQVVPEETPAIPPYTWGLIGETSALSYQDLNYQPDYTRAPPTPDNPFGDGTIAEITVDEQGFGYQVPVVSITDGYTGQGATAQASVSATGAITGIAVVNPGTAYVQPQVVITEGSPITGTGATLAFSGAWTDSGGGVYVPSDGSVTITTGGSGYHVPQVVATVTGCSDTISASTSGLGYLTVNNGMAVGFEWLTEPTKSTDTTSCTLTFTITDRAPGWTPTAPDPANSRAFASAELGERINPRCAEFFQQRKMFAGGDRPRNFWMTRPGLFSNFSTTYPSQDDDAITGEIVGRRVDEIVSLTTMSTGVIVLTGSGAYLVSGGGTQQGITPENATALPQVSSGASILQPLVLGGTLVYLQARGTAIKSLNYNFQVDSFQGTDLTVLATHLFDGRVIVQWAWAEEPYRLLWAVRDDGILLSLAFIEDQQIYGWTPHDTLGKFTSVCSIPEGTEDAVYLVARREINGQYFYITERMASRNLGGNMAARIPSTPEAAWFVDCGARYPLTYPATRLLPGETSPVKAITEVTVLDGGTGYPDSPVVTIEDLTGLGASITATAAGGVITGLTIVDGGEDYTAPTITVHGGTGAAVTATIQTLQEFETADALTGDDAVSVGDVLRVNGARGVVTEVASTTVFTCNMEQPLPQVPNAPIGTLPPILAEDGDWTLTTPVTVIGGLDFAEGNVVTGLADGALIDPQEVVDGCITLPTAASAIVSGYGFSAQAQTLRIEADRLTSQGRRKTIPAVTLRVVDTRSATVGPTFRREDQTELKQRDDENMGQPIKFQTGGGTIEPLYDGAPTAPFPLGYQDVRQVMGSQWNRDGYICIQQSYPLPMTIAALIPEVVVGDDPG
jgi:hypothetical protein